jgi:hypothetical protein
MTVTSSFIINGPYLGTGVSDTFTYSFTIEDKTQVKVIETDSLGIETVLVVDTNYTVNGVGNNGGGTIVRTAGALPSGSKWLIRSNRPEDQQTDFESQGAFFPDVHEKQMDHLTYLILQLRDAVNRSVRFSDTYAGTLEALFAAPVTGNILRWASPTLIDSVDPNDVTAGDERVYPTLAAALNEAASFNLNEIVRVIEYDTGRGAASGNTYQVLAEAGGTQDSGSLIDLPLKAGFELKGLFPGNYYDARQWGLVADGVANDSTVLQEAANYVAPLDEKLHLPSDSTIKNDLTMPNNLILYSERGCTFKRWTAGTTPALSDNNKIYGVVWDAVLTQRR